MTKNWDKNSYIWHRMNIQLTEKKEQIFRSTLKLIHEFGFHGSPMSKIAKEADVAVGSIYHYFPSKEDLIIELYWYCKEAINKQVFDTLDKESSFEDQFKKIWKNLVDYYLQHVEIFGFMEQFYGSPFYEGIRNEIFQQKCERNKIIHFLEQGIQNKQLKDLHVRMLLALYLGPAISLIRSTMYSQSRVEEKIENDLVQLIWDGVKL